MSELISNTVSRRRFLGSLGVLTAGVGLAACGSGASGGRSAAAASGTPKKGGNLKVGVTSISSYLNPLSTTSTAVNWITDPVVESLYTYDDSLNSLPLLADGEPQVSADGLTWTIKLKSGVTFANGDPLTAEHVVAVLNFVSNPKSVSDWTTYFAYRIKSAEAPDDSTVKIVLAMPYGIIRSFLTNLPIVHKDFVQKTDTTMGTGPFKVGNVTQGQTVELVRNDSYHGTKSALDAITFTAIADPGTRLVNLRGGQIDIMTDVPPDNVAILKKDASVKVHVVDAPLNILTYIVADKPPFDNVKVRQAVAQAMDRKGVRDVVYRGLATIAQGPISPAEEGYDPHLHDYSDGPNIAKAKALLAEAGVNEVKFTLMISSSSNEIKDIAQVLADGWKKAGIDATIETLSTAAWVQNWAVGKYQLAMTIYGSGFGGGTTSFTVLGTLSSTNPLNFGYKNPQVDKLLDQAWASSDPAERANTCKQIDKLLADDAIAIPPVYPTFIVAQRTDVTSIDEKLMRVSRIKAAPLQFLG